MSDASTAGQADMTYAPSDTHEHRPDGQVSPEASGSMEHGDAVTGGEGGADSHLDADRDVVPPGNLPPNTDDAGSAAEAISHESGGSTTDTVPEVDEAASSSPAKVRKRPRPGERRVQILQTLAEMLEAPHADRVTTAALAARLGVSEAALYRHFASKAQMFEGLIEFIEQTLFGLINQITSQEEDGLRQLYAILQMLLSFAERNPGMTRVLVGDALVNEADRLQDRINQLIDRLELSIKSCFRTAIAQERLPQETDPSARANLMIAFVMGRWLRFSKGGFKLSPTQLLDKQSASLIL